jgi:hypothetical protein
LIYKGLTAGVRGSRTHLALVYKATRGFEDRGSHRAPSTPKINHQYSTINIQVIIDNCNR